MQFDVIPNPVATARAQIPYLIVLQSDLIDRTSDHIVAPLARPPPGPITRSRLTPAVRVAADELRLLTQRISTLPRRAVQTPVANLADHRVEIIAAIDLLFTGV